MTWYLGNFWISNSLWLKQLITSETEMKGNVGSFVQFIDFSFPSIHKPFQTLMKDQIFIKWKICIIPSLFAYKCTNAIALKHWNCKFVDYTWIIFNRNKWLNNKQTRIGFKLNSDVQALISLTVRTFKLFLKSNSTKISLRRLTNWVDIN